IAGRAGHHAGSDFAGAGHRGSVNGVRPLAWAVLNTSWPVPAANRSGRASRGYIMKRFLLALAFLLPLLAGGAFAQDDATEAVAESEEVIEESAQTIDMMLNDAISPFSNAVACTVFYAV